jgi:hypothetical protein
VRAIGSVFAIEPVVPPQILFFAAARAGTGPRPEPRPPHPRDLGVRLFGRLSQPSLTKGAEGSK